MYSSHNWALKGLTLVSVTMNFVFGILFLNVGPANDFLGALTCELKLQSIICESLADGVSTRQSSYKCK